MKIINWSQFYGTLADLEQSTRKSNTMPSVAELRETSTNDLSREWFILKCLDSCNMNTRWCLKLTLKWLLILLVVKNDFWFYECYPLPGRGWFWPRMSTNSYPMMGTIFHPLEKHMFSEHSKTFVVICDCVPYNERSKYNLKKAPI